MSLLERRCWALPWLVIALLGALAISWSKLQEHRDAAELAAAEYVDCLRLADAIDATRATPVAGDQGPFRSRQLLSAIQDAAGIAGIDADRTVRSVQPRQGTRVGNSPYVQHVADLRLQGISRKQLVTFTTSLIESSRGLRVTSMQLSSVGNDANQDMWNVDSLTLSYASYEPESPAP